MNTLISRIFVLSAAVALTMFMPTVSFAASTLEAKTVSKVIYYPRGQRTNSYIYLFQTAEAIENPDGCNRADFYGISNQELRDLVLDAKRNSYIVDFRISGCTFEGFPKVVWFMVN